MSKVQIDGNLFFSYVWCECGFKTPLLGSYTKAVLALASHRKIHQQQDDYPFDAPEDAPTDEEYEELVRQEARAEYDDYLDSLSEAM